MLAKRFECVHNKTQRFESILKTMAKSRVTIGIDESVYLDILDKHQGQKPAKVTLEQLLLIGSAVVDMASTSSAERALWNEEDKRRAIASVVAETLAGRNPQALAA